ncbi:MAG: hypothetical protein COU69_03390, partial [Candidatus Pacebacteria bacterium CG10_big_fil_rev_8_21_14_0_10_56_10]
SQAEAFRMGSIVLNVLLVLFLVVTVLVLIFAEPLTKLRTGGAISAEQIKIATNLTRLMMFAQLFFAVSNFMTGILQSYQRFIIPAISPILYNLGIVAGAVLLTDRLGIYAPGVGVVMGAFAHMIVQIPLVRKLGLKYTFSFNLKFPGVKQFLRLAPPRVLALSLSEVRNLAMGFFATSIGSLSFLVIRYGLLLMAIPIRFVGVPIGQASLPFLSKEAADTDINHFRDLLVQSLNQVAFLALPATVLILVLRIPFVRIIFGTANFPWEMTLTVGRVVGILSVSIVLQAMVHVMIRAFYALKNTKVPLVITLIDTALYFALSAGLVFGLQYGVLGIAIATTVTAFVEFGLFLLLLNRLVTGLLGRPLLWPQFKMVLASFLMAVFLYLPFRIFDELVFNTSRAIEVVGLAVTTGTIGMLVYIYFAALFEIKELYLFVKLANKFGNWRQLLSETDEVVVEAYHGADDV